MTQATGQRPRSVLLFEVQTEGHHLPWLVYVGRPLIQAGVRLTCALGKDAQRAKDYLKANAPDIFEKAQFTQVCTPEGKWLGGSPMQAAWDVFAQSGVDALLFNNFDTIASKLFRKVGIWGYRPPSHLKGKIFAIYHRPRPFDPTQPGFWKRRGAQKLLRENWFARIYTLDPAIKTVLTQQNAPVTCLPDPAIPFSETPDPQSSRQHWSLPADKTILLLYGTGTRRKGLHVLLEAFEKHPSLAETYHLFIAGKQKEAPAEALARLQQQGALTLVDRYIEESEEAAIFAASDWVLAPYTAHYGSANLPAKAAAAMRPLIASDFHLLGRLISDHQLGSLFKDQDPDSFASLLFAGLPSPSSFKKALSAYAKQTSPEAFAKALLDQAF